MVRRTLDQQFQNLKDEILILGSMVEEATLKSIDALKRRDMDAARQIYEYDANINERRFAIENGILILIATQQPIARDLRLSAAMLEVITELERMGDYAKGIAKVTLRLGKADFSIPHNEIQRMADLAIDMLRRALTAFIDQNAAAARLIPQDDEKVDALYLHIYHHLVSEMIANPETIDHANLLMWTIHNLERLADRAINICERTIFIATGDIFEMDKDSRLFADEEEEEDEEEDDLDLLADDSSTPEITE
ncbi:MAG: phosphate signaling complex protein PhoU [Anaerolineaceae bacterium]|jgi:phosphate transport system protein|nr:phosphate signaling complex protein PhoU [Anaerolineaceae bacterium]